MCNAYAEIGLLVLKYRVYSLCLVVIDQSDCPTYELLQVLHLSFVYPAGICAGLNYFVSDLSMYSVCGTKGYI